MTIIINPQRFHSLKLAELFAGDPALDLHQGDLYEEYQGGTWDFDQVPGVEALYGQKVPDRIGILVLAVGDLAQVSSIGPENKPVTGPFTHSGWLARAGRAAEATGLPTLFGPDAPALMKIFPNLKEGEPWDDGARRFVVGAAGEFDLQAIVHSRERLLRLEILHAPTVEANRRRVR